MDNPFLASPSQVNWNALATYVHGNVTIHQGGIWFCIARGPIVNSEPAPGNADWTLVAGTAYQVTRITAAQIYTLGSLPVTVIPADLFNRGILGVYGSMAWAPIRPITSPGQPLGQVFTFKYDGIALSDITVSFGWPSGGADNDLFPFDASPRWSGGGFGLDSGSGSFDATVDFRSRALLMTTFSGTDPDNTVGIPGSVSVNDGGLGYAVGDTLEGTASSGPNHDYTVTVASIGALGVVTGVTLTSSGVFPSWAVGNTDMPTGVAPQPGVGTGLVLNIDSILLGDGVLTLTLFYNLVP